MYGNKKSKSGIKISKLSQAGAFFRVKKWPKVRQQEFSFIFSQKLTILHLTSISCRYRSYGKQKVWSGLKIFKSVKNPWQLKCLKFGNTFCQNCFLLHKTEQKVSLAWNVRNKIVQPEQFSYMSGLGGF